MNGRILIIDDEETLCYFLKESLEEKGYQASAAHTAGDGLEQLAARGTDLVLLDLKLPDGEGLDVLSEIRKVDAELPVIVLTGHAAVETAVRAMKLGAYDYLEKPVNLAQLISSVAEVLSSTRREERSVEAAAGEVETGGASEEELLVAGEVSVEGTGELEQPSHSARRLRQMKRTLEEVTLLNALGRDLLRYETVGELTESAAEGLLQLPAVDMVAVFVGDGEDEDMVLATQRRFRADVWDESGLRRLPVGGVLGQAMRRWDGGLPLSEAGPDPWIDEVNARLGEGIAAALVPLREGRQVWGLMLLARKGMRAYDRTEIDVFCAVGERLAMALKQASRLASLEDRTSWLAEREARQRLLLENLPDGVVVVDGVASVMLVNRAAERLLGCREEEVLGNGLEGLLGAGATIVRDSLQRDLAYTQEQIVAGGDLEERVPLQMSVSPLRDETGTKSGAIITVTDFRRAKEQEEESSKRDRLSVLAEVSAVVAHEIRNPLAGMVAGIQHLLTKFRAGDERYEALQRILKEGERVDRIIEVILLVTRPPHLELAPCDISDVVGRVVEESDDKARALGVQVRRFHAAGLPLVRADEKRLRQALSKLVLNGIEAMPSGGSLDIMITGPSKGEAEYVEVEICDHGVGIREEDRGRVFEPFYTTKARGTGLGLVIAKRIIDSHGGEIEVLSEEGEGTKVIVRLPLAGRGG
jgi:PAS domain S-box-containing protein